MISQRKLVDRDDEARYTSSMPIATIMPQCGNCGAALDVSPGTNVARCSYCKRSTYLTGTTIETSYRDLGANSASLLEDLAKGPHGAPVGGGTRRSARQLPAGGVAPANFTAFPIAAHASSTYGGSWSPDALIGPPNVFPAYGDRRGAWAPQESRSKVEWIEVEYDVPVPVAAIRVFETNIAGSTYAIVDRSGAGDVLLWAAQPQSFGEAQMLEVAVSPPRPIRRLRVYVVNPAAWTEIDTVALITAEPLPPDYAQRHVAVARPIAASPSGSARGVGVALALVMIIAAAGIVGAIASSAKPNRYGRSVPTGVTEMSWRDNAVSYRGSNGSFVIHCPPNGSPGTVWGSGPYTDDSSLCGAAVHAGRFTREQGGTATIELRPGESSYRGSAQNGVSTSDYGSWSGSFFVR